MVLIIKNCYHGGTTNLHDHLTHPHPSKLKSPTNQSFLDGSYVYIPYSKCSEACAKRITKHIIDIIVHNLHPAALV